ncbi:MAG: TIR domain-containing protein [Pseudonocardia sp.]
MTTQRGADEDHQSPERLAGHRFDVFLSYHSADRPSVERIARRLRQLGVEPWFDRWALTPGGGWQDEIVAGLHGSSACAIFVGDRDMGDWERLELEVALVRAASDREFRLFPVLLPGLERFDPSTLPPFLATRTWVDMRSGVESDRALREFANAVHGIPFGTGEAVDPQDDVCPYRGLEAFDEEHAEFYFGRENHVQRLLERLRQGRFVAVLGPSGSGKSSLVRAGLLPRLRDGAVPGSEGWEIRVLRPGGHPLAALAAPLLSMQPGPGMQSTVDRLETDERTVHLATASTLVDAPPSQRVLLVVDQGEEIFSLCRDEPARRAFLRNLHHASVIPGGRTVVVLVLRADFYPRLARFPAVAQLVQSHQMLIGGPAEDEIRQMIEEPARIVGLQVEPGLVETIRNDVVREAGSLPLLQHALLQTWHHRRAGMLTLAGYHATGGVRLSLAERAEALYGELSKPARVVARDLLLRLTQPGDGTEDTRRRISMAEVTADPDGELAEEVVARFVDERLLTTGTDESTDETWVEISHEALIRGWPRLREWIDSDRSGLRLHRQLTVAAQEWQRLGRDDGALYRGERLREVRPWLDWGTRRLNALEARFLAASIAADRAARTARRRRLRRSFAALVAALVAVSAVAVVAVERGREAARQRDVALSRQLAADASDSLPIDSSRSLALAMRAFTTAPTLQAEQILRRATAESRSVATLRDDHGSVYSARFLDGGHVIGTGGDGMVRIWDVGTGLVTDTIAGHTGIVTSVRVSTDGRWLASTAVDGTVALTSLPDHVRRVVAQAPAGGYTTTADFSPDGRLLAAAMSDGTVRLVDVATGTETARLQTGDLPVYWVAFSPDGRDVVSAGEDATAQIWSVANETRTATLTGHTGAVLAATFHPSGATVLTTGSDGTLRTWDRTTGALLSTVRVDEQAVNSVAVSPDGERIATAGAEGLVGIRTRDGVELARLPGHAGFVLDVSFSPDGRQVVSSGKDGTIRIWDPGPDGARSLPATAAAYSPDGRRIVVGGADGHVRVLEADGLQVQLDLPGHDGRSWPVFSADGTRIASAGEDGTVRVWDAVDGHEIAVLRPHQDSSVWSVAFDPDGTRLVSGADDGTVVISSLVGDAPLALPRHDGPVNYVLFSPDGSTIATAGRSGTIRRWRGGEELPPLVGHENGIGTLAFSTDGSLLASGGDDGAVRVWHADGTLAEAFLGHQGPVNGVDFTPDGRLTSVGDDGTMRVWDVAAARLLVTLPLHRGPATTVDVSPDGRATLTVSEEDKVLRQTFCEVCGAVGQVVDLARARGARPLSPEEERQYLSMSTTEGTT